MSRTRLIRKGVSSTTEDTKITEEDKERKEEEVFSNSNPLSPSFSVLLSGHFLFFVDVSRFYDLTTKTQRRRVFLVPLCLWELAYDVTSFEIRRT
uniref:Uncharacterized protein n=1 Tax=Candidatus Kentrum sp. FM TaxID=2126340 RepID=A0A450SSK9_9GAMM|nr:MAG: hypothetical protein BECKFM1743C_GA0114222_1002314 [Candidatus Kentron sp. FM]VFJ56960.1 MAG: hypothetical protein BECKFM1743A_GA0114220_101796 [Candidatus Kentron sp. FM]VFK05899.1 MAG: hypothetical protein BECKFM1743B_GA0114221_1000614 [Candidatus Kentron sp. FM]